MSFDPYANQGGPAAWDPDADARSKKVADDILAAETSEVRDEDLITAAEAAPSDADADAAADSEGDGAEPAAEAD